MKIGFDTTPAAPAGTYSQHLAKLLARYNPEHEYVVDGKRYDEVDLYHCCRTVLPLLVRLRSIPFVMTVHNLNFLRYPHLYSLSERFVLLRLYRRTLRDASRLITVNRDAREELSERLSIDPRKIEVMMPLAAGVPQEPPVQAELEAVRRKYMLPKEFILMLGTVEPRHNHELVFEALLALRNQARERRAWFGDERAAEPACSGLGPERTQAVRGNASAPAENAAIRTESPVGADDSMHRAGDGGESEIAGPAHGGSPEDGSPRDGSPEHDLAGDGLPRGGSQGDDSPEGVSPEYGSQRGGSPGDGSPEHDLAGDSSPRGGSQGDDSPEGGSPEYGSQHGGSPGDGSPEHDLAGDGSAEHGLAGYGLAEDGSPRDGSLGDGNGGGAESGFMRDFAVRGPEGGETSQAEQRAACAERVEQTGIVICGRRTTYSDFLLGYARARHLAGQVDFIYELSPDDLPALFRMARAFVYLPDADCEASIVPVVEALRAGLPMVLSDTRLNREAAGDAATYVRVQAAGEVAAALDNILCDEDFRHEMQLREQRRAELFSEYAVARRLIDIYNSL